MLGLVVHPDCLFYYTAAQLFSSKFTFPFSDSNMRVSMTNMLIVNLSVADLLILVFGIPEIVMFMINKGWLLGEELCRIQRSVLVVSLYASVMTLLALCVER